MVAWVSLRFCIPLDFLFSVFESFAHLLISIITSKQATDRHASAAFAMEFPPFARTSDDDLFLMDELLAFKDDSSFAHNSNSGGGMNSNSGAMVMMDGLDHVDSLLLGFDLDEPSPFDHQPAAMNAMMMMQQRGASRSFDGSSSPTTTDDMSGSEMSSPPPSYDASPTSSPVRVAPSPQRSMVSNSSSYTPASPSNINTSAAASPPPKAPLMANPMNAFANSSLPYALPVAYFPTQTVLLNMNQKRPFQPEVLPNASPVTASSSASSDATHSKKSKREIRQMKNRESANKSRLRRKAQMSELSDEVDGLTKKQHELENTIAALRAENKSLHDQNSFLRSLVTKPVGSSGDFILPQQQQIGASSTFVDIHPSSLSAMENGEDMDIVSQKKAKTSRAVPFSAASLSLCASVFGVTIFSDYEGGSSESSHIRRPGRVLHSLPASVDSGFSPVPPSSILDFFWDSLASSWTYVSSSELAFGILLNVLSFVVIMGLYHMWQSSMSTSTYRVQKWTQSSSSSRHKLRSSNGGIRADAKRRSVSWQDIRLRDQVAGENDDCSISNTPHPRAQDLL